MADAFVPYPLRLTFGVRRYAFGGRLIPERLGKADLPDGVIAETWEVSDHPSERAHVLNGPYRGHTLGELVQRHPDALVRPGWRGPHLPLLVKLLDASQALPVHVHPDDAAARARYGEPNGKDEAWHVLWAEPGASVRVGVPAGRSREDVREALRAAAWEDVLMRYPIATGDTVDVPAGVLHTFGPGALIFEVQQTSDLAESAMPTDLYGRRLADERWQANVDAVVELLGSEARPRPTGGSVLRDDDRCRRVQGCRNGRFVLERWTLRTPVSARLGEGGFATVTNLGSPLTIAYGGGEERLDPADSCLLPADLGDVALSPEGPGDLVVCFEPRPASSPAGPTEGREDA
jgi:mannose-6-phosphate isomerase